MINLPMPGADAVSASGAYDIWRYCLTRNSEIHSASVIVVVDARAAFLSGADRTAFGNLDRDAPMRKSELNPIDQHVGSRAQMRRLELDISQTEVAEGLGLSLQQVQKYEKGRNRVGASRLQHLSQILAVPVGFFFEGLPTAPEETAMTAESLSHVKQFLTAAEGLALAKAFMRIRSPKLRRSIVLLVEQLGSEDT
jgi:transcriptional regulator with XRE-family HTH domain